MKPSPWRWCLGILLEQMGKKTNKSNLKKDPRKKGRWMSFVHNPASPSSLLLLPFCPVIHPTIQLFNVYIEHLLSARHWYLHFPSKYRAFYSSFFSNLMGDPRRSLPKAFKSHHVPVLDFALSSPRQFTRTVGTVIDGRLCSFCSLLNFPYFFPKGNLKEDPGTSGASANCERSLLNRRSWLWFWWATEVKAGMSPTY